MRIADSDICSSHDLFGTYRRKRTGVRYVREPGNWSETVRTRVRVPALSCRGTYRAACVLRVICLARIAESALTPYVRWPGTWYRRDSDTRSSCGCVLTCCISCNTLGNPRIPSHVRQSHSKRRPCFDLNFPFLIFSYCSGRYRPR